MIELQKMRDSMSAPQLHESPPAFNAGIAAVSVAEKILQGVIFEEEKDLTQSALLLKEAVAREDGMKYNEPKDWTHPARQYLGNVLLKAKRYKEAEQVYREDIRINPNNAWSLTGLLQALKQQGKKNEAALVKQLLATALSGSNVTLTHSVF